MAARRLAEGRLRGDPGAVRRRSRLLAALPAPPRDAPVLRRAHDRPALRARVPGRQGDDLPRPPEGRAPRGSRGLHRAGEPQRRRRPPGAVPRLASPRGAPLLAPLRRAARAQGRPRLGRLVAEPVRPHRAPGARVRGAARRADPGLLRHLRGRRRRPRARARRRHARGRHEAPRRAPGAAGRGRELPPAGAGRAGRCSGSRIPTSPRMRRTPASRPCSPRSTASSARRSGSTRFERRLAKLEGGVLSRLTAR